MRDGGLYVYLVGRFELDSLLGSPLIFESARPGVPKRDKFKVQCMDEKYEQTGGCVSTVNRPPDLPHKLNFRSLQRSLRFLLYSTVE